jgi:hypothetical protein
MDRSLALRLQCRHHQHHRAWEPVLLLLSLELALAFQLLAFALSFSLHDEQLLSCAQRVFWLKI